MIGWIRVAGEPAPKPDPAGILITLNSGMLNAARIHRYLFRDPRRSLSTATETGPSSPAGVSGFAP